METLQQPACPKSDVIRLYSQCHDEEYLVFGEADDSDNPAKSVSLYRHLVVYQKIGCFATKFLIIGRRTLRPDHDC